MSQACASSPPAWPICWSIFPTAISTRPGLDPKSRQIATIASLTTLGGAEHELTIHIRSALRVGCTRQEIIEVILQMTVYAGFPRALSALSAAKIAFAQADEMA